MRMKKALLCACAAALVAVFLFMPSCARAAGMPLHLKVQSPRRYVTLGLAMDCLYNDAADLRRLERRLIAAGKSQGGESPGIPDAPEAVRGTAGKAEKLQARFRKAQEKARIVCRMERDALAAAAERTREEEAGKEADTVRAAYVQPAPVPAEPAYTAPATVYADENVTVYAESIPGVQEEPEQEEQAAPALPEEEDTPAAEIRETDGMSDESGYPEDGAGEDPEDEEDPDEEDDEEEDWVEEDGALCLEDLADEDGEDDVCQEDTDEEGIAAEETAGYSDLKTTAYTREEAGYAAVPEDEDTEEAPAAQDADNADGSAAEDEAPDVQEEPEDSKESASKWLWPVASRYVTSGFGTREAPAEGATYDHRGMDIAADEGEDISASASGTVSETGYNDAMGNYVVIDHGEGVSSVYEHCSELYAEDGQEVEQGERIASVGQTGVATGPHLHFGIGLDGEYVDPYSYLGE